MFKRVVVACALGGCAIAPASALAANPAWHPPTYPSAPKAGQPSPDGVAIGLGVGPNGRASVLYGARGGNLYALSRTSARGAWGSGRRWRANAGTTPNSEISVAVGSKVTALWTDRQLNTNGQGNLFTSTGSQQSGSGRSLISPAAGAPWVARARGGVAYAYGRANAGPPGVFGGASPARTLLASASTIASFSSSTPPGLQSAVDGQGNQTAVWPENGTLMVSSRAAGSSAWSTPAPLPGAVDGAFALSVAPSGAAIVAYLANQTTVTQDLGGGITSTYQESASVVVSLRPAAAAAFGAPETVYRYTLPAGASPPDQSFPMAMTAATSGTWAAVGFVWLNSAGGPAFYLSRGSQVGSFQAPTSVGDPYVPNQEATSWSLVDAAMAIDQAGNAVFAAGGSTTQGQPDSVIASTSTVDAPAWTRGRDAAQCPKQPNNSEGVIDGPEAMTTPGGGGAPGGITLAWACASDESSAARLIGMTSFDALGPPIVAFRASGRRITFTPGENARYVLTATKGSRGVRVSGNAKAGRAVTRDLRLSAGRWKVTLRATLPSGNATVQSRTTRVSS